VPRAGILADTEVPADEGKEDYGTDDEGRNRSAK
jgi:hypothetical protein